MYDDAALTLYTVTSVPFICGEVHALDERAFSKYLIQIVFFLVLLSAGNGDPQILSIGCWFVVVLWGEHGFPSIVKKNYPLLSHQREKELVKSISVAVRLLHFRAFFNFCYCPISYISAKFSVSLYSDSTDIIFII
ncbi:hypothetical protein K1719_029485 [Acacia pycnantha]|nr:hypothetical protein K1719_029485 [Acacia pycnantha]